MAAPICARTNYKLLFFIMKAEEIQWTDGLVGPMVGARININQINIKFASRSKTMYLSVTTM